MNNFVALGSATLFRFSSTADKGTAMSKVLDAMARFAFRTISRILPRHIRRLILWCTVYSQVRLGLVPNEGTTTSQIKKVKKANIHDLNDRMKLSHDTTVFRLPLLFGLFARKEMQESMEYAKKALTYETEQDLDWLSIQFSSTLPACFRYTSRALISRDFKKFFERQKIQYATVAA